MEAFFGILGILAGVVSIVWLLANIIMKKDKRKPLIGILASFVLFAAAVLTTIALNPS
ncbi:MAG: hypothetical protein RSF40_01910 [Oscillospiraceae bacterium]